MLFEDFIQWAATILGILAAVMVAFNISPKMAGWGFVIFTISSVLWVVFGLLSDEMPLTIQNGVLFFINLVGIYRWLLKPHLQGETRTRQAS